jgi:hypothetical protein
MSRVDFDQQEKVLLKTDEKYPDLARKDGKALYRKDVDDADRTPVDEQEWLELFADDEVKHDMCR